MKKTLATLLIGIVLVTSFDMPIKAEVYENETTVENGDNELEDLVDFDIYDEYSISENDLSIIEESDINVDVLLSPNEDISKINSPRIRRGTITWDCIYFGNYWQNDTNNDGVADTNDAKEPIKWRVLSVDGDEAFLLADKILDKREYNLSSFPDGEVKWGRSTIRSWLNGYGSLENNDEIDYSYGMNSFMNMAFSEEEQEAIIPTYLSDVETTDMVFYLSYDDIKYDDEHGFNGAASISTKSTSFAVNNGIELEYGDVDYYNCEYAWWQLRTAGDDENFARCVTADSLILRRGAHVLTPGGVRPAMHIKLSSSQWSYAGVIGSDGSIEEKIEKPKESEYKLHNPYNDGMTVTWDCVYFGKYWQNDTNADGKANIKDKQTKIKWRVLSVSENRALLLSDKILDFKAFYDLQPSNRGKIWNNSNYRSWLNGYKGSENKDGVDYSANTDNFKDIAFSDEEQKAIIETELENNIYWKRDEKDGINTFDKIFFLSYYDLLNESYGFSFDYGYNDSAREALKTEFVKEIFEGESPLEEGDDRSAWFLRSQDGDHEPYRGMHVGYSGYVARTNNPFVDPGARPAMYIDLTSPLWSYAGTVNSDESTETSTDVNWLDKLVKISDTEYELNLATKEKYVFENLKKTREDGKNYKISYDTKYDSKVASMNTKGCVSAKKAGISDITLQKNGVSYKITVYVTSPQFKYENKNKKYYVVNTGENITPSYVNCRLQPKFELDRNAIRKELATINEKTGEITALKKGNVKVSAIVGEGKNARKVTSTVKIFDPTFSDFKFGKSGVINQIPIGKVLSLKIKNGYGPTEWSVSDNSIATIDTKNRLKAIAFGSTTVTAENNGRTISKVINVPYPEIVSSKDVVAVNKTLTLKVKNGVSQPKTEWKVSDGSIATITSKGVLKGIATGKVIVIAINNGYTMTKEITIQ